MLFLLKKLKRDLSFFCGGSALGRILVVLQVFRQRHRGFGEKKSLVHNGPSMGEPREIT